MTQLLVVILNEPAHLPAILQAWQTLNVPGGTVLDSAGARRTTNWLHTVGLERIGELLHANEVKNKTIFAVMDDDDLLQRAITAVERITGDLDLPHRGLLFVIPVTQVRGLIKDKATVTSSATPVSKAANDTDGGLITRNTPVSVVDEILKLSPTIVSTDTNLMDVAEVMLQNPGVHIVCVVNSQQRLVGLLPIQNLTDDLFMQVVPEEFLGATKGREEALQYADLSRTQTAGDAMVQAVSVQQNDRVRDAFRKMHTYTLTGIPIVDENDHVIGYITLLELLALYRRSQTPQA